jgi:hypothetical protein
METGFRFREDTYALMGKAVPSKPPPRVLVYLRQKQYVTPAIIIVSESHALVPLQHMRTVCTRYHRWSVSRTWSPAARACSACCDCIASSWSAYTTLRYTGGV